MEHQRLERMMKMFMATIYADSVTIQEDIEGINNRLNQLNDNLNHWSQFLFDQSIQETTCEIAENMDEIKATVEDLNDSKTDLTQ